LFDLYRANPALFTVNETNRYTANVGTSKHADEVISSLYARGDVQFLNGRLKLTGGLRGEQTNAKGEGALIDPTRNYQRAANGSFIIANGRPAPITTNALEAAKLTNVDRGLHAEKEYLRLFPSLNASYNLRENLIARAGYYWSVGRPDLNQYAGSLTLPDTQNLPSPTNVITVNNVAIKAWSARTVKASLEYYFENVGLISISGFSREIKNFFGSTRFRATPDFLDHYNLSDATYGGYDVATQYNIPTPVRMTGVDFSYKQALTFLPAWARGVQVFVNGSAQRTTGDDSANLAGYIPRTLNAGASLSRPKYILRVKWNYQSRARLAPVASGTGIEPGTFNWSSSRALLDVSGDYFFTRHWSLFANLNNITDAAVGLEIAGPHTPKIAQFRQRERFGSMWTFGARASF
jgi:TonB-dependent receptor